MRRPEEELHHATPRCLLSLHEKANGFSLDGEGIQAWLEWEMEAMRWGGDTAFTTYGFLPGVDYSGSVSTTASDSVSTTPAKPEISNWFGVGKDGVVRLGGDWSKGWIGQDRNVYLKYQAEYQEG